jgi:hypothetical protein
VIANVALIVTLAFRVRVFFAQCGYGYGYGYPPARRHSELGSRAAHWLISKLHGQQGQMTAPHNRAARSRGCSGR